ncbi:MerR family transcriptional regulator [Candidatus Ruminimicrobiellum ovillum]|uniref:MerR family transcriptional regulator n=1 Tax=Candidatus Ruminimicrobiellum ovillum TaxID=1947927 RepID=UPI00355ABC2F
MKKIKKETQLDKTPKYTVKDVAKIMNISAYTVRYYDNEGLIPFVSRTQSNVRMFSDYDLSWFKTVHCLRATDLSINDIKNYINLCLKGNKTIPQRAKIIFDQEKILKENLKELQKQMKVLQMKKKYYTDLLKNKTKDVWNPYK